MRHRDPHAPHEARAIIRDGRIMLAARPPWLGRERTRASSDELRRAGTVICDIEISLGGVGERELTVSQPIGSELDDAAIETLCNWATLIGCSRVWLPDSLVEISDDLLPDPAELAAEPCPTCGVAPDPETAADLIASRRRRGHGITRCPVCLSSMPERIRRSTAANA